MRNRNLQRDNTTPSAAINCLVTASADWELSYSAPFIKKIVKKIFLLDADGSNTLVCSARALGLEPEIQCLKSWKLKLADDVLWVFNTKTNFGISVVQVTENSVSFRDNMNVPLTLSHTEFKDFCSRKLVYEADNILLCKRPNDFIRANDGDRLHADQIKYIDRLRIFNRLSLADKGSLVLTLSPHNVIKISNVFYGIRFQKNAIDFEAIGSICAKLFFFLSNSKTYDDVVSFMLSQPENQAGGVADIDALLKEYIKKGLLYISTTDPDKELVFTLKRANCINTLIQQNSYRSYLEIGVNKPKTNFDKIKCELKIGVDPNPLREDIVGVTSDAFFKNLPESQKFDLIFIDGLHHDEQVLRDINNSLRHLNKNGTIVCHDMLPDNEEMQQIPQMTVTWTGNCWKAWAYLRMTKKNLNMYVLDADHGLGIIYKGKQKIYQPQKTMDMMDYNFFLNNKSPLMNIR